MKCEVTRQASEFGRQRQTPVIRLERLKRGRRSTRRRKRVVERNERVFRDKENSLEYGDTLEGEEVKGESAFEKGVRKKRSNRDKRMERASTEKVRGSMKGVTSFGFRLLVFLEN